MNVPFYKTIDDVTFRFTFLTAVEKKLWSITISVISGYFEKTVKEKLHRNHIFLENLESSC